MEQSEPHPPLEEYQSGTSKEEFLPREGCSIRYKLDGSSRHHHPTPPEVLDEEIEECFGLIRSCSYCITVLLSSWHNFRHGGELLRFL